MADVELAPKRKVIPLIPAKRCSEFDQDCDEVENHYACWNNWKLGLADGYCPYLNGKKEKPR